MQSFVILCKQRIHGYLLRRKIGRMKRAMLRQCTESLSTIPIQDFKRLEQMTTLLEAKALAREWGLA